MEQITPESIPNNENYSQPKPNNSNGCWQAVLYAAAASWNLFVSAFGLVLIWGIEQAVFSGEIVAPNINWIFTLGAALGVIIPMLVLALVIKSSIWQAIYQTWLLGGLFMVLMLPARFVFITDFQLATLFHCGGMLVYLALILVWRIKKTSRPTRWSSVGLALLCGVILAIPWLLNGAFGSIMDVLLGLVASVLFGLSAALTIDTVLFSVSQTGDYSFGLILWDALTVLVLLVMMVSGMGESGNEWVLAFSVPLVALAGVVLSCYSRWQAPGSHWPAMSLLFGLALFWPLSFVDPDELMAVATGGEGDLMGYAFFMTGLAFAAVLLLGVVLLFLNEAVKKATQFWLPMIAAGLALLGVGAMYGFTGQPGFYGERLFVILKDQADLSQAKTIKNYAERRQYVYKTLVTKAETSQAELRKTFDQYKIAYTPYYLENAIEVDGGPLVRMWLKTRPEVDRVLDSPHLRPLSHVLGVAKGFEDKPVETPWNIKMIHADQVWQELNVQGAGIIVGQSDSGVEGNHPEVASQYRGRQQGNDYNWLDPWNHTSQPTDFGGHGTHTLGTIVGQKVGVAPKAEWIGCVNLARNLGNPAYYLDCMQFMLAPYPQKGDALKDGDPSRGAYVLNNSWGCPDVEGCDPNTLLPAVKALRAAGVFVVASAGNDGTRGCGSVMSPLSLYADVYSVGAVYEDGSITQFSSLGPVKVDGSNRIKPDIVAPGAGVLSSYPQDTYSSASGTSMAGPHVVGVVALMWSANPALIGDIDRTIEILNQTAQPLQGTWPACGDMNKTPNNAVGYGLVDAYAAVKAALQVK
jgi:subtilisin family serine protease